MHWFATILAIVLTFFAFVDASDDAAAKRKRDEERRR